MSPDYLDTPDVDLDVVELVHEAPGVHRHGYIARHEILLEPGLAEAAIGKLAPLTSRDWRSSKRKGDGWQWTMKGSVSPTQRAPRNKRLPLFPLNREHKVVLYSLVVERQGARTYVDLHGVRLRDVDRILEGACGLLPSQHRLAYYRRLEVYVALTPRDAHRLAAALGTRSSMRGNKHRLVDDLAIPVSIKSRTRATARLSVYRVPKGTTFAYRAELALVGRRDRRQEFQEEDGQKLEEALLTLLEQHGVEIRPKPARWEPVTEGQARDHQLSRLGKDVYRGRRIPRESVALAQNCHTPVWHFLMKTCDDTETCVAQRCIRSHSVHSAPPSDPRSPLPRIPRSALWRAVISDLLRSPGMLSEVILPTQESPIPFLESLSASLPQRELAIAAFAAGTTTPTGVLTDTWNELGALLEHHPANPAIKNLALVIDPSMASAVHEAITALDGTTSEWLEGRAHLVGGPFVPKGYQFAQLPLHWLALGALLDPLMADLRHLCEQDDLRLVLVTVDARPHAGRDVSRSDYFHDGQVRSIIGDAGRYHTHNRYLVEGSRVVMVKDSLDGLMGRIVF